MKIAFR